MFDIVILNGLIVDGSGEKPFTGHLGTNGQRIADISVSHPLKGRRVIDAQGMAVSPGFVDIHGHSDYFLLLNPQAESKVRQGVTTEIGGNCGYSAGPIFGSEAHEREVQYEKQFSLNLNWHTVGEYHRKLEEEGVSINFGLLVGHNTIRASVMGKDNRGPDKKELQQMCSTVEEGMRDGAFGLSTGLIYSPACFSDKEELVALNQVVNRYRGIFTTHMRNESDFVLEAVREVVEVAKEARVPLQISHLKTSREKNWDKLQGIFRIIEEARREGVDITCDRYPYIASNTGLQAVLPSWALEGDQEVRTERLGDTKFREKVKDSIVRQHPEQGYWETIIISTVMSAKNKVYEGMNIVEASKRAGKEPFEFVMDFLIEEDMNVSANYFTMCEKNLKEIFKKPYTMIGSDSACRADYGPLGEGKPHPRAFGTFPRILSKYVREEKIMDLSLAVKKMASGPCKKIGIRERGVLQRGFYADIAIFDPENVMDKATFADPVQYPTGVAYVIVNGQVTVEEGRHTGRKSGQVLKKG